MPKQQPADVIDYAFEKAAQRFFQVAHDNLTTLKNSGALTGQEDPNLIARIALAITGSNMLATLKQSPDLAKEIKNIEHFI